MSISAFIPVFNEEKRIRYALTSLQWCDEIILLDKTSSDRTIEIAEEFGAKVYIMPNSQSYDVSEFDFIIEHCSSEWVIIFTASDILDIELAYEIKKLTSMHIFEFDIINVPYKRYILGIDNKRSPWHGKYHSSVFRKSVLRIKKDDVHGAISFTSNRRYFIQNVNNAAIRHLTHVTVDSMMDRHIRYWRAEGENYNEPSLMQALKSVLKAFKLIIINRKTYLLGWNGIALSCAYLSYYMMSFVYKWEVLNKDFASKEYDKLRNESMSNWEGKMTNE